MTKTATRTPSEKLPPGSFQAGSDEGAGHHDEIARDRLVVDQRILAFGMSRPGFSFPAVHPVDSAYEVKT